MLGISSLLLPSAAAHATGGSIPTSDVAYLAPSGGLVTTAFDVVVSPDAGDGPPSTASAGFLYEAGTDGYINRVEIRGTATNASNATNTAIEFYAATGTESAPGVGALLGTIPHARTSVLSTTYFQFWETTGSPVEVPAGRFWVILRLDETATGQFSVRKRDSSASTSDVTPAWSIVTDAGGDVFLWNYEGSIATQNQGPFDASLSFVAALPI